MADVCHGDAFDLVRSLPEKSVDLILTSPPYWGQRTYGFEHNWHLAKEWEEDDPPPYSIYRQMGGILGLEPYPEWYVAHLVEWFELAKRVLKPSGSIWANLGDTYFARWASIRDDGRQGLSNGSRKRRTVPMGGFRQEKQLLLIPSRFAIAMQDHRWILRNDLIWHKPNLPPRPEKDRLRLAHEHFFHFVQRPKEGRAKYFYDLTAVEPGENDVLTYTVKAGRNRHSATFPEDLIRPRIRSSCPPGGLVLDPFCGTGRAIEVAVGAGRRAIGFELSEGYARVAKQYAKQLATQQRLL